MNKAEMKERKVWNGRYRGISFEIQNWKRDSSLGFFRGNEDQWTHYIFVNIDKQLDEPTREKFWLEPQRTRYSEGGREHITYDYYDSIIASLEFHGGCTWYSKERGLDGDDRCVKIGCDYQHLWDNGCDYDERSVYREVCETIDSLYSVLNGKIKSWSFRDGNFYYEGDEPKPEVKP